MTFLFGVILIAGVVAWAVAHPLIVGRMAPRGRAEHEPTESESRRRIALLTLRDVEQDYATGKLDADDYHDLRATAAAEALAAIKAVDRAVAGDRSESGSGSAAAGLTSASQACAGCGHVLETGSRFCSACGREL